jgi:hypothetical protein
MQTNNAILGADTFGVNEDIGAGGGKFNPALAARRIVRTFRRKEIRAPA